MRSSGRDPKGLHLEPECPKEKSDGKTTDASMGHGETFFNIFFARTLKYVRFSENREVARKC